MNVSPSLDLLKNGYKTTTQDVPLDPKEDSEESVQVDVDVDSMSVSELDALVNDYNVIVPANWLQKVGDSKKMTLSQKRNYLKTIYGSEEVEEESAEDPTPAQESSSETEGSLEVDHGVEEPPLEVEPTTKEVKQASTEITEAAPAGEVVVANEFTDAVYEIESLNEDTAKKLVYSLSDQAGFTQFKLGGVFSMIQSKSWFSPYDTFQQWVEQEYGVKYRKALYLIGIYNTLSAQSIPWDKVKDLGWTKLSVLCPVLNEDNFDKWIAHAENNTVKALSVLVKEAQGSGSQAQITDEPSDTVSKTFKLHEDQNETVTNALSKSKDVSGTSYDTVALEHICLDYLNNGGGQPTVHSVSTCLVSMGLEKSLEALDTAFPKVSFSVVD